MGHRYALDKYSDVSTADWLAVRWVDPPALVIPEGETAAPSHASQGDSEKAKPSEQGSADMGALFQGSHDDD